MGMAPTARFSEPAPQPRVTLVSPQIHQSRAPTAKGLAHQPNPSQNLKNMKSRPLLIRTTTTIYSILLAAVLSCWLARADQTILNPVADTLQEALPTSNYGADEALRAGGRRLPGAARAL